MQRYVMYIVTIIHVCTSVSVYMHMYLHAVIATIYMEYASNITEHVGGHIRWVKPDSC